MELSVGSVGHCLAGDADALDDHSHRLDSDAAAYARCDSGLAFQGATGDDPELGCDRRLDDPFQLDRRCSDRRAVEQALGWPAVA
jgi:hypothetical protein